MKKIKSRNKIISRCLNCGKDTGCPNKLVCDECRNEHSRKGKFYSNFIVKDSHTPNPSLTKWTENLQNIMDLQKKSSMKFICITGVAFSYIIL